MAAPLSPKPVCPILGFAVRRTMSETLAATNPGCFCPACADGARREGSSTLGPVAAMEAASGVTSTTRAPWARNALAWERGPGVGPPPRACGARMTTGSQPDARSAFAAERMPPSMTRREPTARRDIRMTRARSASPCTTGRAGAPGRWAVLIVGLDDQHLHRGDQPEELPHEGGWRHCLLYTSPSPRDR